MLNSEITIVSIIDRANFDHVCASAAFHSRVAAQEWADKSVQSFTKAREDIYFVRIEAEFETFTTKD